MKPASISNELENLKQHRARVKNALSKVNSFRGDRSLKKNDKAKQDQECNVLEQLENYVKKMKPVHYTFSRGPACSKPLERVVGSAHGSVKSGPSQQKHQVGSSALDLSKSKASDESTPNESVVLILAEWKKNKLIHNISNSVLERMTTELEVVPSPMILYKLLRPTVYLDLHMSKPHDAAVGCIGIQLYTERCPAFALEFLQAARTNQTNRLIFKRNFLPYWMEWELKTTSKRNLVFDCNIAESDVKLKANSTGVLSFPLRYLHSMQRQAFTFTINFEPLASAAGKRVIFGKVVSGKKVLDGIKYGPVFWNGNPQERFEVKSIASDLSPKTEKLFKQ